MSIYYEFTPPDIEGTWSFSQEKILSQNTQWVSPTIKDITTFEGCIVKIVQKNSFVTIESLNTPTVVRLGIWKPTFHNGETITWELVLSNNDNNNNNIAFLQVIENDTFGRAARILYNAVESGFSVLNLNQRPSVAQAILIRE